MEAQVFYVLPSDFRFERTCRQVLQLGRKLDDVRREFVQVLRFDPVISSMPSLRHVQTKKVRVLVEGQGKRITGVTWYGELDASTPPP